MPVKYLLIVTLILILDIVLGTIRLDLLSMPLGFTSQVVVRDVNSASQMALSGDQKILFVAGDKEIYAIPLTRHSIYPDDIIGKSILKLAYRLDGASGVAYNNDTDVLYFSQKDGIYVIDDVTQQLLKEYPSLPLTYRPLLNKLPENNKHTMKYIKYRGGRIYFVNNSPCDACMISSPHGRLISMNQTGGDVIYHASGIRNNFGFDWHGDTNDLWFTDNSKDSTNPALPNELNVISTIVQPQDSHFGFPFCYGKGTQDDVFIKNDTCKSFIPSKYDLPARCDAKGTSFYRYKSGEEASVPPQYVDNKNVILVAEHGTTDPASSGFCISVIDTNNPESYEVLIDGWLVKSKSGSADAYWGQPVDVLMVGDGSFLISDSYANAVYRIAYNSTVEPFVASNPVLAVLLPLFSAAVVFLMGVVVFGAIVWERKYYHKL
ncbi:hypothetical protein AKO1_008294 [Acrasis kona]|uniref:Uncharacterized protein n=1 Tax=Acrasis kona TaxID=1008807 RepID=A0AAW2YNP0_9EUKA